jgi:hypothetical protein
MQGDGRMTSLAARARRILAELGGFLGSARGLSWVAIAAGTIFRVADYINDRPLWKDEGFLAESVIGRPLFEFDRPLPHDQLAPPGFLIVARISWRVLGDSSYALRSFPLVCGIAALVVLGAVARRSLSPRAVPIALAMAAVSDDLIYYSTEFKQYSTDLLIALGCCLLAWDLGSKELSPRRLARAAALGIAAMWSSFPSVFVLAGAGLWLAGQAALGRRWRRLRALAVLGTVWAANFAACFTVARRLLAEGPFMWSWWGFAFLPLPPRTTAQAEQVFWQFVNVFTNPVGIVTPLGPMGTALLSLVLFAVGLLSWATKRRWGTLVVLSAPIALAMLASALHRYPFHGRLILYLVPSFLLPMAEGVDAIGRRCGRLMMAALVALLLVSSSYEALDHIDRIRSRGFDSHGDQRNDLLDYLEWLDHRKNFRHR